MLQGTYAARHLHCLPCFLIELVLRAIELLVACARLELMVEVIHALGSNNNACDVDVVGTWPAEGLGWVAEC